MALALYLEVKGNKPEDRIVFNKIKQAWQECWVKPKIKAIRHRKDYPHEIGHQHHLERITIDNGQRYFAVHTWLKEDKKGGEKK